MLRSSARGGPSWSHPDGAAVSGIRSNPKIHLALSVAVNKRGAEFTAIGKGCFFRQLVITDHFGGGNDTTGCTLVILRHNRVLLFIQLE